MITSILNVQGAIAFYPFNQLSSNMLKIQDGISLDAELLQYSGLVILLA